MIIKLIFGLIYKFLKNNYYQSIIWLNKKKYPSSKIDPTSKLGDVELQGNIYIGKNTYFNSGQIITGKSSKIIIGDWCAIGYNVKILSITHDIRHPTGKNKQVLEKDIVIGDNVWIGSNVFIKEGVNIGDNSIIGANAAVTKNVIANTIVGGVPAKLIRNI